MSNYAVSDLHGYLDLYLQIKAFLKPEDKVYFLGDAGDRGPQSWETIKTIAKDSQWTYLMGNHEHIFAGAMLEYLHDPRLEQFHVLYPRSGGMKNLLMYNGGSSTLEGWIKDGADPTWVDFLLNLPYMQTYHSDQFEIILNHAGFTDDGKGIPPYYDMVWDRSHFYDPWPDKSNNTICIHGHTPCSYLARELSVLFQRNHHTSWSPEENGAIWYADGHKIDIDMGTYQTGYACLFDLDTFDEHYFQTKLK